jgi:hypothetical protein
MLQLLKVKVLFEGRKYFPILHFELFSLKLSPGNHYLGIELLSSFKDFKIPISFSFKSLLSVLPVPQK